MPAVRFRGFLCGSAFFRDSSLLTRTNSVLVMYTSPRTSNTLGGLSPASLRGIAAMVLRLWVTSSPTPPLPRVALYASLPFS